MIHPDSMEVFFTDYQRSLALGEQIATRYRELADTRDLSSEDPVPVIDRDIGYILRKDDPALNPRLAAIVALDRLESEPALPRPRQNEAN